MLLKCFMAQNKKLFRSMVVWFFFFPRCKEKILNHKVDLSQVQCSAYKVCYEITGKKKKKELFNKQYYGIIIT